MAMPECMSSPCLSRYLHFNQAVFLNENLLNDENFWCCNWL